MSKELHDVCTEAMLGTTDTPRKTMWCFVFNELSRVGRPKYSVHGPYTSSAQAGIAMSQFRDKTKNLPLCYELFVVKMTKE